MPQSARSELNPHASLLNDSSQQAVACWNRDGLKPHLPSRAWQAELEHDARMLKLQGMFLDELRSEIFPAAAQVPRDPDGFIDWFEALKRAGPGQHDPLFSVAGRFGHTGTDQWFFGQEAAGEAGFDDLVAMTQVDAQVGPVPGPRNRQHQSVVGVHAFAANQGGNGDA